MALLRAALSPAIALSTIDGVVSVSVAAASDYDPVELAMPRRDRDGAAKRARDHLLPRSEEHDACGWSSAVMERGLALRRRRGCASSSCCSSSRSAATVVVVQGFRREEASAAAAAAHDVMVGGDQGQAGEATAAAAAAGASPWGS